MIAAAGNTVRRIYGGISFAAMAGNPGSLVITKRSATLASKAVAGQKMFFTNLCGRQWRGALLMGSNVQSRAKRGRP
jgi:hypothetical protein